MFGRELDAVFARQSWASGAKLGAGVGRTGGGRGGCRVRSLCGVRRGGSRGKISSPTFSSWILLDLVRRRNEFRYELSLPQRAMVLQNPNSESEP